MTSTKHKPRKHLDSDLQAILEVFNGDCRQARHFAMLYVDHTPSYAGTLALAVRNGDPDSITRASHGIRESAAMVGAVKLQLLAETMERSSRDRDLGRAQPIYQSLVEELEHSRKLIGDYAALLLELKRGQIIGDLAIDNSD